MAAVAAAAAGSMLVGLCQWVLDLGGAGLGSDSLENAKSKGLK